MHALMALWMMLPAIGPVCRADQATVRVLLQDLQVPPALNANKVGLAQVIADEAGRAPGLSVLSADEVRSALQQEADKQLLGCAGNSCIAEIAEALDADWVVSGRIDNMADAGGGATLVALSVLNARAVVVVNRVVMTWRGTDSELPDVLRAAAQTLLLEPELRVPGTLELTGLPPGARVLIDDVDFSADALAGPIKGLTLGPHTVQAEAPDMAPRVLHVVIKAKQDTSVPVAFEPAGVPGWLIAGGAVGALVAGSVVALSVLWATAQSEPAVTASVPAVGLADVDQVNKARSSP
jgi:hypothetical protein